VTGGLTGGGVLLLAAIGWPMTLALLSLLRPVRRRAAGLGLTMAWPALLLAFTGDTALQLRLPGLFTSMQIGLDGVGRPFVLLTALLWSVVAVHARTYMRADARRTSFAVFMLAAGTGNLGLTLAQDALSFYLFFALMTFAAYGLVVHTRTAAAVRAGRVYIAMAVAGEALIIAGLFTLIAFADSAAFENLPAAYDAVQRPGVVAALLLLGFGVKAGMAPVHLWLPLAHPVAPTPASALLSGAMIKAGVLGWLRFLPLGHTALATLGMAVIVTGVLATVLAAAVGVSQRDVKTVLAYSSISQVGFMTVGVGAALVLPAAAPLLVLAVAVYALHHAPAKAALFLSAGIVRAGRPWLLAGAALPAMVLAGAPLTSGAVAKSALKSALGEVPQPWPVPIDALLSIAAIGTTLLMARALGLLAMAAPRPVHASAEAHAGGHAHAPRPEPVEGKSSGHAAPAAGLLVPWLVLALLSGVAAVWLPLSVAPLGELPLGTDPAYIAAALWPIALGAIIAAAGVLLFRRYPALTLPRVPAGDIIALFEEAAVHVRRAARPLRGVVLEDRLGGISRAAERRVGGIIDRGARYVERTAEGPLLGLVFCVVALLLFLAVR
jgi:hydrogenase-4 component B